MDVSEITNYLYVSSKVKDEDIEGVRKLDPRLVISMIFQTRPPSGLKRPPTSVLWLRTVDFLLIPIPIRTLISSMLSMRLSLTVQEIFKPLKNTRLVILALVANFVLVPLIAFLITLILPLDGSVSIRLKLLSTAAGAPFLPKLVEVAKGRFLSGLDSPTNGGGHYRFHRSLSGGRGTG